MHKDLLSVARQLASIDPGRPRQAALRRAASTAYYAIFHALSDACVRETIGWKRRADFWTPIIPLYRSVDHASAKRVFSQLRSDRDTPATLRRLAELFIALQDTRLRADYDPSVRYKRSRVFEWITDAEMAVELLSSLPPDVRLNLVVKLLTKTR